MLPAIVLGLWCVAALPAIGVLAIGAGRWSLGSAVVYGLTLVASLLALGNALAHLIAAEVATLTLACPGSARMCGSIRLEPSSVIANLGGAAASLYALGYGRHEAAPLRVLRDRPQSSSSMSPIWCCE